MSTNCQAFREAFYTFLILTKTLCVKYYFSQFTAKKNEVQRARALLKRSQLCGEVTFALSQLPGPRERTGPQVATHGAVATLSGAQNVSWATVARRAVLFPNEVMF